MIYVHGVPVEILPPAEGEPDYELTSRIRIRWADNGQELRADVPYMRADDGLNEIEAEIKKANASRAVERPA